MPPCISIAGNTIIVSSFLLYVRNDILQEPRPYGAALFGMELKSQDVVPAADSRHGLSVIGRSDDVRRIGRRLMIGMDKIHVGMGRKPLLQPVAARNSSSFQPICGTFSAVRNGTMSPGRKPRQSYSPPS